jgi:DNA invertase Pin-like site-specific DNA recombinase
LAVAYSYVRFSTPDQAKGDSLRRQLELSENYAQKKGLTLNTTLTFHDLGVSAYKGSNVERGRLGDFLDACDRGLVERGSYLLVESLDRISRAQVLDAFDLFRSILKRGINIVTLQDERTYLSHTTELTDLIISLSVMSRAHDESLTKSKRLRSAWANKRANIATKKLTARCPLWMKINADRTAFDLIPENVKIVEEIITLAKNGFGQVAIASMFNKRGTPNFSGKGTGWASSYICKIITSRALYGEFTPGATQNGKKAIDAIPIPNYYPAVITQDEFHHIQRLRKANSVGGGKARKGTTIPSLLSGMVKCGYCDGSMNIGGAAAKRIKTPEGETIRPGLKVLVCERARRGLGCFACQWSHPDFETSFLTFCRGLDLDSLLADLRKSVEPPPVKLEDQVGIEEQKIIESQKGIDKLFDYLITAEGSLKEQIDARMKKLVLEQDNAKEAKDRLLKEIQERKDSGTDSVEVARATRSLIEQMESVTDEERFKVRAALAAQLRRFIDRVELHAVGRLVTPEFIKQQKKNLMKAGMKKKEVDLYCEKNYQTEPKRQGRGFRGRYASRDGVARFFVIRTKNGGMRVVYPDHSDPTSCVVEAGFNDGGPSMQSASDNADVMHALMQEIEKE